MAQVVCGKPDDKPHPKPSPQPPVQDGKATVESVSVSPDNSSCVGTQGPKVNATGRIAVSGAAKVTYRWTAGGASKTGVLTVHNPGALHRVLHDRRRRARLGHLGHRDARGHLAERVERLAVVLVQLPEGLIAPAITPAERV